MALPTRQIVLPTACLIALLFSAPAWADNSASSGTARAGHPIRVHHLRRGALLTDTFVRGRALQALSQTPAAPAKPHGLLSPLSVASANPVQRPQIIEVTHGSLAVLGALYSVVTVHAIMRASTPDMPAVRNREFFLSYDVKTGNLVYQRIVRANPVTAARYRLPADN